MKVLTRRFPVLYDSIGRSAMPDQTEQEEPEDRLGMTPEQWEWFQRATHGYGEQDENGVDLSQLRANLCRTPTERVERALAGRSLLKELRRAGTRIRR
jgi:hypothetical protein